MVMSLSQTFSALEGLVFMLAMMAPIKTAMTATIPTILKTFFMGLLWFS